MTELRSAVARPPLKSHSIFVEPSKQAGERVGLVCAVLILAVGALLALLVGAALMKFLVGYVF